MPVEEDFVPAEPAEMPEPVVEEPVAEVSSVSDEDDSIVGTEEPKKKKLRQYKSLEEFFNVTGFKVGDIVQIKRFGNLNYEETAILTSIRLHTDGAYRRIEICFGSTARSLSDLFKCCKYFKNNEWLPFGIEE